jgi:heme-degrading monooxygenase HmoA
MYARLGIYQGSPNFGDAQVEEGLRYAREEVLPWARQRDGFRGVISLLDRQSGKLLSVTLWESEEAMHASEEEAKRLGSASVEAHGETMERVERYEVALLEMERRSPRRWLRESEMESGSPRRWRRFAMESRSPRRWRRR